MLEIERKFLVQSTDWGAPRSSAAMAQGYVFVGPDRSLRVRRVGDRHILTLKVSAGGIGRHELEWEVDPEEGWLILDQLCVGGVVVKTRHLVDHAGKTWEIDVFEGDNAGLIVAEIELTAEDEAFEKPPWLGPEVTHEPRFLNAALSQRPFRDWGLGYDALLAEMSGA